MPTVMRISLLSGPGRVCPCHRRRMPAHRDYQAQCGGGCLEGAPARLGGEHERSNRLHSRGRERFAEDSLLQVSFQPAGIFVTNLVCQEREDSGPCASGCSYQPDHSCSMENILPAIQCHPRLQLHQWLRQPHQVGPGGDSRDVRHEEIPDGECALVPRGVFQAKCLCQ